MRALVYVALLALATLAALSGRLHVALALGALKALLIAAEYMELRHADLRHLLVVGLAIGALLIVLIVASG